MNPNNRINQGNNRRTKATAAIPMAGAIVTAALLLSGLSLITSYQPVMAQQNMTGGGVEGGGATTSTTDNATSTMGGAAQGGNATTSDVRMNIEQARMALQNNDTQGAMMYLDMALSALGGGGGALGNMTGGTTGGGALGNMTGGTTGGGGGPLEGIFGGGQ
jgi:hypothetical protein